MIKGNKILLSTSIAILACHTVTQINAFEYESYKYTYKVLNSTEK